MKANQETINQTAKALHKFFGGDPNMAEYVADHLAQRGLLKPTDPTELDGWQGGMKGFELELDACQGGPVVTVHFGTEGEGGYMAVKPFMARYLGGELVKAADTLDGDSGDVG